MLYVLHFVLFLLLALSSAFASLAAPVAVKPGSLIIKRKTLSDVSTMAVNDRAHTTSVRRFKHFLGLEEVQVNAGASVAVAMDVYKNDPSIEYVEPNYIVHALSIPNDTYFGYQWGLQNSNDADINAIEGWENGVVGNYQVVLGAIDTGVDYRHPDLINNLWVNSQEIPGNGIDDDHNGYVDDVYGINAIAGTGDPMDDNIHGTHVAGIIGAEGNNKKGISGVMQKAKIIACKFLDANGSGDTGSALACMDYFAELATRTKDPVKLVATNNSWGGGGDSQAFRDAVEHHRKLGILFIAAASNEANNNDISPTFPSNIGLSNVVTVAATDSNDALASFSNYGKRSVLIAAPGVNILSTIPGGYYNYLSGTSMAAPFVTGLAGLIKVNKPEIDWISLKNLIIAGGEKINSIVNTTVSSRRVRVIDNDGEGSLSCKDQMVNARLLPKGNAYSMRVGQSLTLSMLKINCDKSQAYNTGTTPGGLLNDLGQGNDDLAYDGVFNGAFKPTIPGSYVLSFPGNDNINVTVTR